MPARPSLAYVRGVRPGARDRETDDAPVSEGGPALRDAATTAERVAADEREAEDLRERLRDRPPASLEPDEKIAAHLADGEHLHALRRSAILREPGGDDGLGSGGPLYLTSARIVHLGQVVMSIQLHDILEASIAGERLLISLPDGEGFSIDIARPRAFRAELAAAIREARR